MGDLANMTSAHGEVNGWRLLCWLRSRAELEEEMADERQSFYEGFERGRHAGRAELLTEMADDLERELDTEGVNRE